MPQPTLAVRDTTGAAKTIFTINPNGPAAATDAQPVVMANDQAAIPVVQPRVIAPQAGRNDLNGVGSITAQVVPGGLYTFCLSKITQMGAVANTMANCGTTTNGTTVTYAGTAPKVGQLLAGSGIASGTYIKTVDPGVGFTISLPATATATVTLNVTAGYFDGVFEASANGVDWTSITVTPKGYAFDSTPVTSAQAPGLFAYQAGRTDHYLRFRITAAGLDGVGSSAATNITRIDIDAFDRAGGCINLPYVQYIAATAATFPTGIPIIMPVDTSLLSVAALGITALTGSSQTITWYQTNDFTGAVKEAFTSATTSAIGGQVQVNTTQPATYGFNLVDKYFLAVVTAGTAVTACTITGCVARCGGQAAPVAQNILTTISQVPMDLLRIAGQSVQTSGTNGVLAVGGGTAHSAAVATSPVICGGKVATAVETALVANDACQFLMTTAQQLVTKDFAAAENDFRYQAIITDAASTQVKAAGSGSIKNSVTGFQLQNTNGTATEVTILDGSTAMWKGNLPVNMALPLDVHFPTPLRGSSASALNIQMTTAGANVYVNVQGFQSF